MHVALELRRREDLLEQRAQLDLGPGAARLDVGEHALEVADAGREALHLPQPLLHRLELVADELERLAEALLERGLELLVDGDAHLLELLLVAGLELDQPRVHGGAHAVQRLAVGLGHLAEPLGHAVELGALHLGHGVELRGELLVAVGEAARELGARLARGGGRLLARGAQLLAHGVGASVRAGPRAHEHDDEQRSIGHGQQQHQPEDGIGHARPSREIWRLSTKAAARDGSHRLDGTRGVGRMKTAAETAAGTGAQPSRLILLRKAITLWRTDVAGR